MLASALGAVSVALALSPGPAPAQSARTEIGGGGGGSSVRIERAPGDTKPQTVTQLKLAPIREWTNAEGKKIHAELLSWPVSDPDAATKPVAELEFDIVRAGKVRLRVRDKIHAVTLSTLSEPDQAFVRELEQRLKPPAAEKAPSEQSS
jgi:hypothetical protein